MQTDNNVFSGLAKTQVGAALWDFLNDHDNVIRLLTAVDLGLPAVYGVEAELERSFPYVDDLKGRQNDKYRQAAGYMVKLVLEPHGYTPDKPSRRKSPGGIFQSGHTYKR